MMSFITELITGFLFQGAGIDWLFWAFAIVTVLLFIDLIIPDPIPFVDEAVLTVMFIALLVGLILRGVFIGIESIIQYAFHPVVLSFVLGMGGIIVFDKIILNNRKRRQKK